MIKSLIVSSHSVTSSFLFSSSFSTYFTSSKRSSDSSSQASTTNPSLLFLHYHTHSITPVVVHIIALNPSLAPFHLQFHPITQLTVYTNKSLSFVSSLFLPLLLLRRRTHNKWDANVQNGRRFNEELRNTWLLPIFEVLR